MRKNEITSIFIAASFRWIIDHARRLERWLSASSYSSASDGRSEQFIAIDSRVASAQSKHFSAYRPMVNDRTACQALSLRVCVFYLCFSSRSLSYVLCSWMFAFDFFIPDARRRAPISSTFNSSPLVTLGVGGQAWEYEVYATCSMTWKPFLLLLLLVFFLFFLVPASTSEICPIETSHF